MARVVYQQSKQARIMEVFLKSKRGRVDCVFIVFQDEFVV